MSYLPSPLPLETVAAVLAELSAEIEALGASLCRDPGFVQAHMADLQAIDLIAQKQRSIANLLQAECPRTAIERIGIEELKERMIKY